jgi:hypothetical protein
MLTLWPAVGRKEKIPGAGVDRWRGLLHYLRPCPAIEQRLIEIVLNYIKRYTGAPRHLNTHPAAAGFDLTQTVWRLHEISLSDSHY